MTAIPPDHQRLIAGIAELHQLLREAYDHYFAFGDGYCKSAEGTVWLEWPTYFAMKAGQVEPKVCVYSYVFGPERQHDFDSIEDALATVREWRDEELARTYTEEEYQ